MQIRSAGFLLFLVSVSLTSARTDDTPTAIAQKLFDAMKAHDATAATSLFLPGATVASVDASGKSSVVPFEKFVEHVGSSKSNWLERMWTPKVLEDGSIAVVWVPYDFHLDGKFSHCGIDSFTMLKTPTGWKLVTVSYTRETSSCTPSPLGPPPT